ncbi:hypothetical protein N0V90_003431 [Kalmusia sp. IMI 367209]|nr:hypothetical protein N0V90_003431 [Kalmusia sp. IMI 367209]
MSSCVWIAIFTLLAVSQLVLADFDIYRVDRFVHRRLDADNGTDEGTTQEPSRGHLDKHWNVLPSRNPTCGDIWHLGRWYHDSSDDPYAIGLMEMHFTHDPLYHFTVYKERPPRDKYELYGLTGWTYGYCKPAPVAMPWDFSCLDHPTNPTQTLYAHRKFICHTRADAQAIANGK